MLEHERANAAESAERLDHSQPDNLTAAVNSDASQERSEPNTLIQDFLSTQSTSSTTHSDLSSRIEDYLDQIYAPMLARLPYARRQELRNEMRAHIGQLIAAHEELGSESGEAVAAALRQFGPPELVAHRWVDELPSELSALGINRAPSTSAFAAAAKRLAIGIALWVTIDVLFDRNISGQLIGGLYFLLGVSIPCVTGYFIGRRYSNAKPEATMLAAQASIIPFWPVLLMWLENVLHNMQPDIRFAATMGAMSLVSLAPLGCACAWIGKVQTRRAERRRAIA